MLKKFKNTVVESLDYLRYSIGKVLLKLFLRYISYSAMKKVGLGKTFDIENYEDITADMPYLLHLYKPVRTYIDRNVDKYYLVAEKRLVDWGNLDGLVPEVVIPKDCREFQGLYNYFIAYATNDDIAMAAIEEDPDSVMIVVNELGELVKRSKIQKAS